jgi:hypothetical protein
MEFCQNEAVRYSTVIETNSSIWWPSDSQADLLHHLLSGAERVFFFASANRCQLELQLARPLDRTEIVWDAYAKENTARIPDDLKHWAAATIEPLDPERNAVDVLFRVLAHPKWRERPLELNVYGRSNSIGTLEMLARRLDLPKLKFRGAGFTSSKIWSENQLLVHAARFEGFPGRLIESMWHQRPAVVTELVAGGGLYEHGRTAFVAAAPQLVLLDAALEEAWQQRFEWPKMGANAQETIQRLAPPDPVDAFCNLI